MLCIMWNMHRLDLHTNNLAQFTLSGRSLPTNTEICSVQLCSMLYQFNSDSIVDKAQSIV